MCGADCTLLKKTADVQRYPGISLKKRAEMGRVSSHLFTISYSVFFQPLGFLYPLFPCFPCVLRICLMPQMASSLTNLPEDLLAVFVGYEAESDSTLFLQPQTFNCSAVHTLPLPTVTSGGAHNPETSCKSTQGQKKPKKHICEYS